MQLLILYILLNQTVAEPLKNEYLTYCTHAETVSLNPFRKFDDVYELTYKLLLTTSYISNNSKYPAILKRYSFVNDGKTLRATINESLKWNNGDKLTPYEAAIGIAVGLKYRALGERVKVIGTQNISLKSIPKQIEGVKIIDENTFEINFESEIKNLTGVLVEALSVNSRQNRLWPAKLIKKDNGYYVDERDFISRYKIITNDKDLIVKFNGNLIRFIPKKDCISGNTFSPLSISLNEVHNYTKETSDAGQAVIGFFVKDSIFSDLMQRRMFIKEVRDNIKSVLIHFDNLSYTNTHFIKKELPVNTNIVLEHNHIESVKKPPQKIEVIIGLQDTSEENQIKQVLSSTLKNSNYNVTYKEFNLGTKSKSNYNFIVGSSKVDSGRQIWLQDIIASTLFKDVLIDFPKTNEVVNKIKRFSASTTPISPEILLEFEKNTFEEVSIIPLFRRNVILYSKKSSPVILVFNEFGELSFEKRR